MAVKTPRKIEAYIHPAPQQAAQEPDAWVNQAGAKVWRSYPCYYATVLDGSRLALGAGPFRSHQEALDQVAPVKALVRKHDGFSAFYAFGTVKMKDGSKDGKLNGMLGVTL